MTTGRRNLVFIGMPGSGKSTVGVLVAKRLGLGFIDTDLLIQEQAGRTLQEIVDQDGYLALRRIEEQVLLALEVEGQVTQVEQVRARKLALNTPAYLGRWV